jgi:hypothetical protein
MSFVVASNRLHEVALPLIGRCVSLYTPPPRSKAMIEDVTARHMRERAIERVRRIDVKGLSM